METAALIGYLMKSGLVMAVMQIFYHILLARETFFIRNRFYLLSAGVLALVLPALDIQLAQFPADTTFAYVLPEIVAGQGGSPEQHVSTPVVVWLTRIWLLGVVVLSLRFALRLASIVLLIRRGRVERSGNLRIVWLDTPSAGFSFFRYLFLRPEVSNGAHPSEIRAHEEVHARQWHSADLLLFEILSIFQWFNPFVYLAKMKLREVHEYLADEGVAMQGFDLYTYKRLLVDCVTGLQPAAANHFNRSITLKRLVMLNRKRTSVFNNLKIVILLPVCATLFMLTSVGRAQIHTPVSTSDTTNAADDVYIVVETQPEFPGGNQAFMQYLVGNVQYPKEAQDKKIEGTVYVSMMIQKDGSVSDVGIMRSVDPLLDNEAVRVVSTSPKWIPGKVKGKPVDVQYTIPITFSLGTQK